MVKLPISDNVGTDWTLYYDHIPPFELWKDDSWEDKEYWGIFADMVNGMKRAKRNSRKFPFNPPISPKA